jgi:DNA-binding NarL/FixJ family response regulator
MRHSVCKRLQWLPAGARQPHNVFSNFWLMERRLELRVFLVEDMQRMRGLLDELFTSLGGIRVVGHASTEAEGKMWLDDHPGDWDVAILDLVLDQGAGMSLIRHAKRADTAGSVLVFSSFATPGVRKHCLELGADAVFDKSDTAGFITFFEELRGRENAGP